MKKSRIINLFLVTALILTFLTQITNVSHAQTVVCKSNSTPTTPGGTWEKRMSPTLFRAEASSAVLDGKIYVAGGLAGKSALFTEITNSFAVYDPATDTWKDLAPLPKALHHVGLAGVQGHIYLTGGYTALDFIPNTQNAWAYDPKTDSWKPIADMPTPRAAHTTVALNNKLYLVGGVTAASTALWSYDPATDQWDVKHAPMPTAREHVASAVLDGKLYIVDGETPNSNGTGAETYQRLATLEVYDPSTDQWTHLTDAPTARSSVAAGVLDGKIHVVSGENVQDNCVFAQHEVYDPQTKLWTSAADFESPRHGAVSGVVDNHWYLIDGATVPGLLTITALSNVVNVFIPTTN